MFLVALGTLGKLIALAGGVGFAAGAYAANQLLSATGSRRSPEEDAGPEPLTENERK
jgi:hypothetical protein